MKIKKKKIHVYILRLKQEYYSVYTVYREIFNLVLFSPLWPSSSAGEFKTGSIPMSQNISLSYKQNCLANSRWFKTVCKCIRAKITQNENNIAYSINYIFSLQTP